MRSRSCPNESISSGRAAASPPRTRRSSASPPRRRPGCGPPITPACASPSPVSPEGSGGVFAELAAGDESQSAIELFAFVGGLQRGVGDSVVARVVKRAQRDGGPDSAAAGALQRGHRIEPDDAVADEGLGGAGRLAVEVGDV